jgi:hypothetical protein
MIHIITFVIRVVEMVRVVLVLIRRGSIGWMHQKYIRFGHIPIGIGNDPFSFSIGQR